MRIAICDDERLYLDVITENVCRLLAQYGYDYEVDQYMSGQELIEAVNSVRYDLIVLDINMEPCSGFDVAQHIFNITQCNNLIFISSEESLVYKAINFRPLGFIRKGNFREDTKEGIERWHSRYGALGKLIIKDESYENGQLKTEIKLSEIMYISSDKHYIEVHCIDRVERFRSTMSGVEHILENYCFVKTHKSFIYNLEHIRGKKTQELRLINGETVYISRGAVKAFEDEYREYIRKVGE